MIYVISVFSYCSLNIKMNSFLTKSKNKREHLLIVHTIELGFLEFGFLSWKKSYQLRFSVHLASYVFLYITQLRISLVRNIIIYSHLLVLFVNAGDFSSDHIIFADFSQNIIFMSFLYSFFWDKIFKDSFNRVDSSSNLIRSGLEDLVLRCFNTNKVVFY